MTDVALLDRGARGIGAAIGRTLKAESFTVAARFIEAIQTAAYRREIANKAACSHGVANVDAELGPLFLFVNNGGITRDSMSRRMTRGQWRAVPSNNLDSTFTMAIAVMGGMRERRCGRIINTVCPGHMDTEMATTVPDEKQATIVAGIPTGQMAGQMRSPKPSALSLDGRPHSAWGRSRPKAHSTSLAAEPRL